MLAKEYSQVFPECVIVSLFDASKVAASRSSWVPSLLSRAAPNWFWLDHDRSVIASESVIARMYGETIVGRSYSTKDFLWCGGHCQFCATAERWSSLADVRCSTVCYTFHFVPKRAKIEVHSKPGRDQSFFIQERNGKKCNPATV